MAGAIKKTTGLTGMVVASHPHKSLKVLYDKILRTVALMPEDYTYRRTTEAIVGERLATVNSEPNIEKVEQKINGGQIEEVIKQAEKELSLARKFLEWRAWEPIIGQAPDNQWKWPAS